MTEEQRLEIYLELADKISPEGAEFLMAQSPPGGWEQFATKSDLRELSAKFEGLSAEFKGLSAEFRELAAHVTVRFAEFEVRMEQRFAQLEARRSRDVWSFAAAVAAIMVTVVLSVAFIG